MGQATPSLVPSLLFSAILFLLVLSPSLTEHGPGADNPTYLSPVCTSHQPQTGIQRLPDFPPGCPANTTHTCPKWSGRPLFPHPLSLPQSSPAPGMTTAAHQCQSLLSLSASPSLMGARESRGLGPQSMTRSGHVPRPALLPGSTPPSPRTGLLCSPPPPHLPAPSAASSPYHLPPPPAPCPCPLSPILNKEPELPFYNTR